MASRPMRSFSGVQHVPVRPPSARGGAAEGTAPPCTPPSSWMPWRSDRSRRIVSAVTSKPGQRSETSTEPAPQREHVDLALAMVLELDAAATGGAGLPSVLSVSSSGLHRPYRDCERSFSPPSRRAGRRHQRRHGGGEGGGTGRCRPPSGTPPRSRGSGSACRPSGVLPRRVAATASNACWSAERRPGTGPSRPAPARGRSVPSLSSWNATVGEQEGGELRAPSMHRRAIWSRTPVLAKRSSTEAT